MTAIVAGSFDPVTVGHIDIIERALAIFGNVHVLVAVNPDKKYMFSAAARAKAVKMCFEEKNITVVSYDGFVSDYIASVDCNAVVVRGVRGKDDIEYESSLCAAYRSMGIKDMLLLPSKVGFENISSSAARDAILHGEIPDCVPVKAMEVLKEEL